MVAPSKHTLSSTWPHLLLPGCFPLALDGMRGSQGGGGGKYSFPMELRVKSEQVKLVWKCVIDTQCSAAHPVFTLLLFLPSLPIPGDIRFSPAWDSPSSSHGNCPVLRGQVNIPRHFCWSRCLLWGPRTLWFPPQQDTPGTNRGPWSMRGAVLLKHCPAQCPQLHLHPARPC